MTLRIPEPLQAMWDKDRRLDEEGLARSLEEVKNRTILDVWHSEDFGLMLTLDDGSYLMVEAVWLNTGDARSVAGRWTVEDLRCDGTEPHEA